MHRILETESHSLRKLAAFTRRLFEVCEITALYISSLKGICFRDVPLSLWGSFLLDGPIDRLIDSFFIDISIDRLIDSLIHWSIDPLIDRLIDWLIDWLIDCFAHSCLIYNFSSSKSTPPITGQNQDTARKGTGNDSSAENSQKTRPSTRRFSGNTESLSVPHFTGQPTGRALPSRRG